jgi:RimJ/RimL family protein N-acetyltransferase
VRSEAPADRLRREVRLTGPAGMRVRRLWPGDLALVERGLARLGPDTLYRRFLAGKRAADVDLAWVAELGGSRHLAYGACLAATGEPLGVARAVIAGEQAELAVTVVDRWQGHGVGTELAGAVMADLRARGTEVALGTVSLENRRALALSRRLGARRSGPVDGGVTEMRARVPAGRCRHRAPDPHATRLAPPASGTEAIDASLLRSAGNSGPRTRMG